MCGPRQFSLSLAGVLVTPQYPLFGAYRIVLGIRWILKRICAVCVRLFSRREAEPAENENEGKKDIDSPKPTTDVDKSKIIGNEEKEREKQPS